MPHQPSRRTAVLALGVAVLAACAPAPGTFTQEERMDATSTLAARPTSEDVIRRYERMEQALRERLDAELGPFEWYQARERSESTCGFDFPAELGGRVVSLAPWAFDGGIPREAWAHATAVATDVVSGHGFAVGGAQIDQGGLRTFNAVDTTLGAQFTFGTGVTTSFRTTTGCHLPAAPG